MKEGYLIFFCLCQIILFVCWFIVYCKCSAVDLQLSYLTTRWHKWFLKKKKKKVDQLSFIQMECLIHSICILEVAKCTVFSDLLVPLAGNMTVLFSS